MTPDPYRVRSRRRELADTVTLVLEPVGRKLPPRFTPGQFSMLYVPGVGEIPISYSGDPEEREVLVHTIRDVGAVSRALCWLRRGSLLGVRGPFGHAWPLTNAGGDMLVVAGGLGLAPLRPALYHLARHRDSYRRVTLLYGARRPSEVLFGSDLARWADKFAVEITVDRAGPRWRGHVGVVTQLLPALALDPARTLALVCGPEIMMRFVAEGLLQRGLDPERVQLSLERNMRCGLGTCGHCQLGPVLVCRDGPVLSYARTAPLLKVSEL